MAEAANVRLVNLKKSVALWTHSRWKLVAEHSDGSVAAVSEEFRPTKEPDTGKMINRPGDAERGALESLVNGMIADGWNVIHSGSPHWWNVTLAKGSTDEVDRMRNHVSMQYLSQMQTHSSETNAKSFTTMWVITLLVAIVMFAICILLAFTMQLEIRPA